MSPTKQYLLPLVNVLCFSTTYFNIVACTSCSILVYLVYFKSTKQLIHPITRDLTPLHKFQASQGVSICGKRERGALETMGDLVLFLAWLNRVHDRPMHLHLLIKGCNSMMRYTNQESRIGLNAHKWIKRKSKRCRKVLDLAPST